MRTAPFLEPLSSVSFHLRFVESLVVLLRFDLPGEHLLAADRFLQIGYDPVTSMPNLLDEASVKELFELSLEGIGLLFQPLGKLPAAHTRTLDYRFRRSRRSLHVRKQTSPFLERH